jgi:hypothetical protein
MFFQETKRKNKSKTILLLPAIKKRYTEIKNGNNLKINAIGVKKSVSKNAKNKR